MKFKISYNRPKKQTLGMSRSRFKTYLKQRGHKVKRDFFKNSVSHYKGRAYRFRWWSNEFLVDISCPLVDFDRWANSTDVVVLFNYWGKNERKIKPHD